MKGKIIWFNSFKGYGELVSDKGKRFFFTKDDIIQKNSSKFHVENLELKNCSFYESDQLLFGKMRAMEVTIEKSKNIKTSKERVVQC